ncbi:MAG: cytochrome C [Azoarcus sp.]|nr:cytochrome C [Azoarcus sp.]PKO57401.1 MAG: cytochrome C [Betaproteobacteria bacterium HGW-Betaproteobacteria-19]
MFKLSMTLAAAVLLAAPQISLAGEAKPARTELERGRYLVQIAGCNDCHTPGYAASDGKVAEREWLTGDQLGWQGPWGTTYAANLRAYFSRVSEAEWLQTARTASYRPPMPSPILRDMADEDLRALYRFVRTLGPAGEAAPAYVPPGREPIGPVVRFPMPPG